MLTRKAKKTLIILILVLLPFSIAEGDNLYCVSLKKDFKISNNIYYGITSFDFEVSNAEVHNILHKPLGWVLEVSKDKKGNGGIGGCILQFAGSVRLNFFYDDFVIIKKKSGVKLKDVKLTLKLETDESLKDGTDNDTYNGDKTYNFTNKNFNIHRCKNKLY
ncbi:hypothetical protein [Candidatus Magnetominusculus dajiuhuensis]|uniref:hypothetical protein n=1 Tax=Candidatus Magnetominusculus dajiuhuensis TaxID=3137712 RepID=UPI003B4308E9